MMHRGASVAVVGVSLLAIVMGSRILTRHRPRTVASETAKARSAEYRQSPIAEKLELFRPAEVKPSTAQAAPQPVDDKQQNKEQRAAEYTDKTKEWSVVAATLLSTDAAERRARGLKQTWNECACTVFPKGESEHYFVVVGTNLDRTAADRLRDRAKSAGLPGDTYVTKLIERRQPDRVPDQAN